MSIGQKVATSVRWMAGARVASQILTWAATLIVIRILSPDDYALMAIASVVIGLLEIMDDMGLGEAIVKNKKLTGEFLRQVFGYLLIFSAIFYAVLFLSSPHIAEFFEDERLILIINVLGLQILIRTFYYIPDALMRREMDFRRVSIINFSSIIVQSITVLSLAFTGFGVWSLVLGTLVATIVKTIGAISVKRYFYWPNFSYKGIEDSLSFGGLLVVHRVLYYFYSSIDTVIIGKLVGHKALGHYNVALQIASMPIEKFMMILNEVGFSAFSNIQDDQEQMKRLLCKAVRMLSITVFPVFIGISCVAPELVNVLLGEKWQPAAVPLQIISVVMALKMMNLTEPLLFAMGCPNVGVKVLLIGCVIMPVAFYIGSSWGLLGVSLAWLFAYPPYFCIAMKISLSTIGMKVSTYVKQFMMPAIFSAIMYINVYVAREYFSADIGNQIILLAFLIFIGAVTYTSLVVAFQRDSVKQLYSMIRG